MRIALSHVWQWGRFRPIGFLDAVLEQSTFDEGSQTLELDEQALLVALESYPPLLNARDLGNVPVSMRARLAADQKPPCC